MKSPNNLILCAVVAIFGTAHFSQAQSKKMVCSFSFVNAIDLPTPTFLTLDGSKYRPAGYPAGAVTDGGVLYEGRYGAVVSNSFSENENDLAPLSTMIEVKPGVSPIWVAFLKSTEQSDGRVEKQISVVPIPNQPPPKRKNAFYATYVGDKSQVSVEVNDQKIILTPLKPQLLSDGSRLIFSVGGESSPDSDSSSKTRTISPEDGGNFMIVVYDKSGSLGYSVVKDEATSEERIVE